MLPGGLESFENKHRERFIMLNLTARSLPVFVRLRDSLISAKIKIAYIPDKRMVESKSLKLYLFSFRNHGDFHEDCMNIIMKDLIKLMQPKYIEVMGEFTPRGGIAIDPYCNYGMPGTKWEKLAEDRLFNHDMNAGSRI